MENIKEKCYEVMYNTRLDKLVLRKTSSIRNLFRKMRKHKFIITIVLTFIMFSMLNITLILNFMKVLQNI